MRFWGSIVALGKRSCVQRRSSMSGLVVVVGISVVISRETVLVVRLAPRLFRIDSNIFELFRLRTAVDVELTGESAWAG